MPLTPESTHRQAEPAAVEEQNHAERHGNAEAKRNGPRGDDADTEDVKADTVGRQPQTARPFAPEEFAESQNDEREAEGRDGADNRIAMRQPRRDDPPIK